MSRMLVVSNLVLALAVCILAWMLHGEHVASARHPPSVDGPHAVTAGPSSAPALDPASLSARLDRIDSRLDALARARPAASDSASQSTAIGTSALPAAEADRRLAAMLPGPVVDHEAMARYRAQLAMLPAAEQAAIEAALSRAINQDRLRLRL